MNQRVAMASVARIIDRDLVGVRRQLEAYPDEAHLWKSAEGVSNPPGNLALHLAGNLEHFIGACLGDSGYVRDREAEFSTRDVPRAELIERLESARRRVGAALAALEDSLGAEPYPQRFGDLEISRTRFLIHLVSHLAYHLGQIDYHRRLTTGSNRVVGALQIAELAG